MIQEATIEATLDRLENSIDTLDEQVQDLASQQPELLGYLTNEDVEAFTESERDILLFAAVVIYESVRAEGGGRRAITGKALTEAEERHYELIQQTKGPFRERVTPFFEQSEEEELLAFVEDLTISETEGNGALSNEAREPFFVTLATVVEVLTR